MHLLALETATEACSVALWIDGEVRERFEIAPRRHAELALPWANALLAEAGMVRSQLDAIAVGRGPGAFTGVRLAIALAQGIALALDRPVLPVSTLATLACRAAALPGKGDHVLAAIDARMGEVYAGRFLRQGEDMVLLGVEAVGAPASVVLDDDTAPLPSLHGTAADAAVAAGNVLGAVAGTVGWAGVGTGFAVADGALAARLGAGPVAVDATALPHAADTARLAALAHARGEAISAECLEPAYLRNNVALTLAQQRAARGG